MSVTIHPATLRDMTYIAVNMREADRREIRAVFPGTDTQIGTALHEASPGLAWTAWLSGRPVCAFGIARLFPGLGSGWAYGTRAMPSAMKPVTRFCLRKAAPKLLREGFRRVEVRSAIDHDLSHRWLEHLGFRCEGIARDYGSEGLDFVTYAATRARSPLGSQAFSLLLEPMRLQKDEEQAGSLRSQGSASFPALKPPSTSPPRRRAFSLEPPMTKPHETKPRETPRQIVERWARREMQQAATPADRDLMALVTHRIAGLFAPEQAPGQVTAEDWRNMLQPAPDRASLRDHDH